MEKSSRIEPPYKCKTCGKGFYTYQALGGHQGIHRKVDQTSLSLNIFSPKTSGLHRCKICAEEFETGPALGGHMTRHRLGKDLVLVERKEAVESDAMVVEVVVPLLKEEELRLNAEELRLMTEEPRLKAEELQLMVEEPRLKEQELRLMVEEGERSKVRRDLMLAAKEWRLCV